MVVQIPIEETPPPPTADSDEDCSTMVVAVVQDQSNGDGGLDETTPLTSAQESFNLGKAKSASSHAVPTKQQHFATERSAVERPTFAETFMDTVRLQPFSRFRNQKRSARFERSLRLNVILSILLLLTTLLLLLGAGYLGYDEIVAPYRARKAYEAAVKAHAIEAAKLVEKCQGMDWRTACERLGAAAAGARRRSLLKTKAAAAAAVVPDTDEYENAMLHSDDPTVTYDQFCLRVNRMKLYGEITFPYYSNQLLHLGGNQTMALFIQVKNDDVLVWCCLSSLFFCPARSDAYPLTVFSTALCEIPKRTFVRSRNSWRSKVIDPLKIS